MPDFLDKARDLAETHEDKVDGALDKVVDLVDEKTGGKGHDQAEKAVAKVKDALDEPAPVVYGKPAKPKE